MALNQKQILPIPRINIQQLPGNDMDYLDLLFDLITMQYKAERNQHFDHLQAFLIITRIHQETIALKDYPEFKTASRIVIPRTRFYY